MSTPLPFYWNHCCPTELLFLFLKDYLDVDLFSTPSYTVTDGQMNIGGCLSEVFGGWLSEALQS